MNQPESHSNASSHRPHEVATLGSKLDALKAEKAQLDQELKGHQDSRAAAKVDLKKAENLRAKENEEYVRPVSMIASQPLLSGVNVEK